VQNYGLYQWADNNFIIDQGLIKVNYGNNPSLLEIIKKIRNQNIKGPILLRFEHLIEKQIKTLYENFEHSIKENNYDNSFHAVFPLKVNQFPGFVEHLIQKGLPHNYGLEAGSKAEIILAMALNRIGAPITVNGFKDYEMIDLGFIAAEMGHNITIIIEGISELESIIQLSKHNRINPNIGLRVRLHAGGIGIWAKSGGVNSKFGLTATELIEAIELLKENNLLEHFRMIHFHIGSQMSEITPLKKAIREAGNIYAELRKLGANNLDAINIGGGIAVEYGQNEQCIDRNYTIREFSNDVVFLLKEISEQKGVKPPRIFTESGRYIAASHSVLVAPVLELFSQDYQLKSLKLKPKNPPLIEELNDLYNNINQKNSIEFLHDSLDHLESLFTLFDLGYIDLQDRSNAETLVHLIIKKALYFNRENQLPEMKKLQHKLQERYLVNISLFQSMPDFWGLKQKFPVVPIHNLDQKPIRSASLWDITCDSDGEIAFNYDNPLFLHDIDVEKEDYFLGFFLQGAYQEVLSMKHNLFTKPNEAIIEFNENGYNIKTIKEADKILDILENIGYDKNKIYKNLKDKIQNSSIIHDQEKTDTLAIIEKYLSQNGYLRTIN